MVLYVSGAIGTIFTTFGVYNPKAARLEIYSGEGTLFVPDPNAFGDLIFLYRPEDKKPQEFPLCFDNAENSRRFGVADMAAAIRGRREARADCA
jgi:hypothetical protein